MHAITLAVADVGRSAAFYRALLGIDGSGIIGTEYPASETAAGGTTAMFTLDDGLIVSVYGREDMRKDSGVALAEAPSTTIGHFEPSQEAAQAFLDRAAAAGATMLAAPDTRPWGMWSGFFQDPDGHLWEVVANPGGGDPAGADPEQDSVDPESIE
ncbi:MULTISPECIES: VOC family protein [unclassified Curtobacterium]|uniref:VOC family protein n=1 Tax=unclassified Curtobacterium TaxID=257496 RepID=UPI0020426719|nr:MULTISPECIES: VOC family protein [unclassified Curtobacterium]MCM3522225.1 VOC family protein [Curtobacterium sp. P97]MDB6427055.1 VOC family protein [Curtobacterium sp. 20TX0008]